MIKKDKKALLVLSDGTVFEGRGFGASTFTSGEVVFNTSMTGYQEILTDPSYAGQMIVMTYPHIGNYGLNALDVESRKIFARGLIVKDNVVHYSNYRAKSSLDDYLKRHKIPGISDIDTRGLVRHIRDRGALPAVLSVGSQRSVRELVRLAQKLPRMEGQNLAQEVSCRRPYLFKKGEETFIKGESPRAVIEKRFHVIAYDFGVKENILRLLNDSGCRVTVVPYDYDADHILHASRADGSMVDGVFLSNGPGDPEPCSEAIRQVKKLLGKKPIFGICLGHQILALALGAKTYKLKFGHHGGNQPVMELKTKKVEITAQNHGFAVDETTLPQGVQVTHRHMNDNTVAGIASTRWPAFSVQYHPESSPGPHDSRYLFERFREMMGAHAKAH